MRPQNAINETPKKQFAYHIWKGHTVLALFKIVTCQMLLKCESIKAMNYSCIVKFYHEQNKWAEQISEEIVRKTIVRQLPKG